MYLKKIKVIIFCFFLCLLSSNSLAGVMNNEEAAAYAGFIRDLVDSTKTLSKGDKLCMLGSDEVSKVLLSQTKKSLELDKELSKISSCKAIYVAQDNRKGVAVELIKFNKNKIMTVAIFNGFTEIGGMVQVQMGRRSFELILNPKEIKLAKVRINALFMGLVIN